LVLKGEPHRRPIFAGEGARRWPAATRSRGRQEVGREGGTGARGVEDCGGCYYLIVSRRWGSKIRPGVGRIPSSPNVSDTRIQHKMCLHFQDTSGNVSEAYPYWKRVGYGYAAY